MSGPRIPRMAWRNLWRNRRRTAVTLSSITFGVLLSTIFTGMGDWQWRTVIDFAARMGGGHVTIQHRDYLDKPSLSRTVHQVDVMKLLPGEVKGAVTRITGQAMLATAGHSAGVGFIGIDPAKERPATLSVLDKLSEGEMFKGTRGKGIILGKKLAETLGLKLGKKVVYTMSNKEGEIVSGLARVQGIIHTRIPGVDASLCLLPIDTVREALGYEKGEATQIAVFLQDHRRAEAIASALNSAQLEEEAVALTWSKTQPDLAGFIAIKVNGLVVMELFIILLIAAGIFNTLFVSVMERLREFGVMMAIGLSPGRLFELIFWESVWLGLVGLGIGALVTSAPYYLLATQGIDLSAKLGEGGLEVAGSAMPPVLRVDIYPENALAILATILTATILAGLYPAWRAARVVPVESIKLV